MGHVLTRIVKSFILIAIEEFGGLPPVAFVRTLLDQCRYTNDPRRPGRRFSGDLREIVSENP